jgi:hypothetical protein
VHGVHELVGCGLGDPRGILVLLAHGDKGFQNQEFAHIMEESGDEGLGSELGVIAALGQPLRTEGAGHGVLPQGGCVLLHERIAGAVILALGCHHHAIDHFAQADPYHGVLNPADLLDAPEKRGIGDLEHLGHQHLVLDDVADDLVRVRIGLGGFLMHQQGRAVKDGQIAAGFIQKLSDAVMNRGDFKHS